MRFLLGLALGFALGVLLWPRPAPVQPPPPSILAVVDVAGLAQATCDARVIEAWATGWAAQRSVPCECGR